MCVLFWHFPRVLSKPKDIPPPQMWKWWTMAPNQPCLNSSSRSGQKNMRLKDLARPTALARLVREKTPNWSCLTVFQGGCWEWTLFQHLKGHCQLWDKARLTWYNDKPHLPSHRNQWFPFTPCLVKPHVHNIQGTGTVAIGRQTHTSAGTCMHINTNHIGISWPICKL